MPRLASLCSLGLIAACLCSCQSGRHVASGDPFLDRGTARAAASGTGVVRLGDLSPPRTAHAASASIPEPRDAGDRRVSQVAWDASAPERVEHSDFEQAADPEDRGASQRVVHAEFTAAEPRQPVVLASGQIVSPGLAPPVGIIQPTSPARHFPDEYLCDGGDRGYPVHYDDYFRRGLNTQDTVAEYVDHHGKFHMKPTNTVCVYAPRFGAVRTVSAPQADFAVDRLASADDVDFGVGLKARTSHIHHAQREAAPAMRMRSRASGFEVEGLAAGVDQATVASSHTKLINAYEDLNFIQTGRLLQTDEARLAAGIQAAFLWTRDQNPLITASTTAGQEVRARFSSAELIHLEDLRVKGDLRIVKLADKRTALPGDELTFTIRYDNTGDFELHHIRIIDNLTPRLVYIENSATADRDGRLVVEDNGEGTSVLTYELAGPLPGRSGGIITFRTRVR